MFCYIRPSFALVSLVNHRGLFLFYYLMLQSTKSEKINLSREKLIIYLVYLNISIYIYIYFIFYFIFYYFYVPINFDVNLDKN